MKKKIEPKILNLSNPQEIEVLIDDPAYYGRMNAPDASAWIKGPCGDEMEFYLVIKNDKLKEVKYFSPGCIFTKACAAMTARSACGKTIEQALSISAGEIKGQLQGLPPDHLHCSILAVTTLYRAIADYLLSRV